MAILRQGKEGEADVSTLASRTEDIRTRFMQEWEPPLLVGTTREVNAE